MGQWEDTKEEVLFRCKRFCCFCEQYKGIKIEVHHIVQRADGGKDTNENAIPLCFDCHQEIGSYNPRHPKGNKYSKNELMRIRDDFYNKIENIPRKPNDITDNDKELLEEFKADYTDIIEYCIRTDFTAELVNIYLHDNIYNLYAEKWSRKKKFFSNDNLENLKINILTKLEELNYYLTDEFLRLHEPSGNLIFKNQSWEEGCKLRDEFRPNSDRIRSELVPLLDHLYFY